MQAKWEAGLRKTTHWYRGLDILLKLGNVTGYISEDAECSCCRFQSIPTGAGHGFFRAGENQNATEANRLAREQGIQRLKEILKGL